MRQRRRTVVAALGAVTARVLAQRRGVVYRLGVIVDEILDGAAPGNLPIERPNRFELVLNMPVARDLGLSFPRRLLLRADEVIP